MDIRGAGNLLGDEQSGHIREVGYELYQHMLGTRAAEEALQFIPTSVAAAAGRPGAHLDHARLSAEPRLPVGDHLRGEPVLLHLPQTQTTRKVEPCPELAESDGEDAAEYFAYAFA